MCGIVGILGKEPVAGAIFEALRRLEYRGYDSAGIAVLENGSVERVRAPGKLGNLKAKMNGNHFAGTTGIGHTRWATHGVPNETNAHPHVAGAGFLLAAIPFLLIFVSGVIADLMETSSQLLVTACVWGLVGAYILWSLFFVAQVPRG